MELAVFMKHRLHLRMRIYRSFVNGSGITRSGAVNLYQGGCNRSSNSPSLEFTIWKLTMKLTPALATLLPLAFVASSVAQNVTGREELLSLALL